MKNDLRTVIYSDADRELAERDLTQVKTGGELGARATIFQRKSAEAILQLAMTVGKAYGNFYEPFAKTGNPGRKTKEHQHADAQWQDFLAASGYTMKKHAKLLRRLYQISESKPLLSADLAKLPNTVESLSVIAETKLPDNIAQQAIDKIGASGTTAKAKRIVAELEQKHLPNAKPVKSKPVTPTVELPDFHAFAVPVDSLESLALALVVDELIGGQHDDSKTPADYAPLGDIESLADEIRNSQEFLAFTKLVTRVRGKAIKDAISTPSLKRLQAVAA